MKYYIDFSSEQTLKEAIVNKLKHEFGKNVDEASPELIYKACALVIRDRLLAQMAETNKKDINNKKLYYLSMEFLAGRSLANNIINLMQTDSFNNVFKEFGLNLEQVLHYEPEAGLGSGGLGRLAACFMDSLTTMELPAVGCGIRYEYGLFKQLIKEGEQVELPDWWLKYGNIWEVEREEEKVEVRFGGTIEKIWSEGKLIVNYHNYKTIEAIPYDFPISGYGADRVNYLRLWQAKATKAMDMQLFNRGDFVNAFAEKEKDELISKVLYPADNNQEGKMLRLMQEYFLSSATIQWIIKEYKTHYGSNFLQMPDKIVIQINDTHPALAIPEMMRILMDDEGLEWDEAWYIVTNTFAYTNHTVMAEALEKWPIYIFKPLLPRIFSIIKEINLRNMEKLNKFCPCDRNKHEYMAVISHDQINMSNLCLAACFAVNGVSALHGRILTEDLFADYARMNPERFHSITNGITFRRWLLHANPELSELISSRIGTNWLKEPSLLANLKPYADDQDFRKIFAQIKQKNKKKLAAYIRDNYGTEIDICSIFDIHAKRLHEYKRQLLKALHILYLYNRILENPDMYFTPVIFIFAAKAAPGYVRAKQIIKLINSIAELVNNDQRIQNKLKVVFLENYNVSLAEILIPAADLSEQISTAGKEASGTGNMKFMLNGAITIGTLDGANVEIAEQVGKDNIYLFGLRAEEVRQRYQYQSDEVSHIYTSDYELHLVLDQLIHGPVSDYDKAAFRDIYQSLLYGDYGMPDPYMVIRDFREYVEIQEKIYRDYNNPELWWRKAVLNTASAGYFSSDRTIQEYNKRIWHLEVSE
jgi:starch phosphorylase